MLGEKQKTIIRAKIIRAEKCPSQSIYLGLLAGMFISIGTLLMGVANMRNGFFIWFILCCHYWSRVIYW